MREGILKIDNFDLLHNNMSNEELEEFVKYYQLDPTDDRDVRFWRTLNYLLMAFAKEGCKKDLRLTRKKDASTLSIDELIKKYDDGYVVRKDYKTPRSEWNFIDYIGDYKKIKTNLMKAPTHFEQKNEVAIFRSCTASKPYKIGNEWKNYPKKYKCDCFVWSYTIVPFEMIDEWPFNLYIGMMNNYDEKFSYETSKTQMRDFIETYNYKNHIYVMRNANSLENKIIYPELKKEYHKTEKKLEKFLVDSDHIYFGINYYNHPIMRNALNFYLDFYLEKQPFTLNKKA